MSNTARPYSAEELAVMRTHEPEFMDTSEERWLATVTEKDERIDRLLSENYWDLIEQMREAWGTLNNPGQEIGWCEIEAFISSRMVHKPTTSLRERIEGLKRESNLRLRDARANLAAHDKMKSDRNALAGLLREVVEDLRHCAIVPPEDPRFDRAVEIAAADGTSYGAVMSSASRLWRESLRRKGYPVGGEFTTGPCRAVVESLVRRIEEALKCQGGEGGNA